MNKKGFILSTYVYILLTFFLLILGTTLVVLNNTKMLAKKIKDESIQSSGMNAEFSLILQGDKEMELFVNEEFIDPGYIAQTTKGEILEAVVNSNVDTSNEGDYVVIYTVTYNGETKSETRQVRVYNRVFNITNIVQNGSFENGLDGWTQYISNASIIDGVANVIATNKFGALVQSYSNYTTLKGHKVFACANMKGQAVGTTGYNEQFFIAGNDGVSWTYAFLSKVDTWEKVCDIFTVSPDATKYEVYGQDVRSSGWTTFYMDDVYSIDLTEAFGAGNEPTKEWCYDNIEYFDGTKSIIYNN